MKLRPYQNDAIEAIENGWEDNSSQLLVLPTGTGKTIVFTKLIDRMIMGGRTLVIAHREELIWQAVAKIKVITGIQPSIEMADYRADEGFFQRNPVVVSSIQTQNACKRYAKFDPTEFELLIIDEAHHAPARSYKKLIDYYKKHNPNINILGVTATPDRADKKALGMIFDRVAYEYKIQDAIDDGWLVPISQRSVIVNGLDFSSIKTTCGDLNGKQLAAVMEYESNLHGIAQPTLEIVGDRKALVFASSVAHAERLSEIFNRYKPNRSEWVCGKTPKDSRRETLRRFADGKTQILVNVGCFTEGFDEPSIEVIVLARPTKSRALFAQMVGRGTRTLTGTLDGLDDAVVRKEAIANSTKENLELIDFVGNTGRHRLIHATDLLGGDYTDEEVSFANTIMEATEKSTDVKEALEKSKEEVAKQAEEKRLRDEAEQQRRQQIRAKVDYSSKSNDPFAILQVKPVERHEGWYTNKPCSDRLAAGLKKFGVEADIIAGLDSREGSALIGKLIERSKNGKCTYKQAKTLRKYGYSGNESKKEASSIIDGLAAHGWRHNQHTEAPRY